VAESDWTIPRTWVPLERVGAQHLNGHLRDPLMYLKGLLGPVFIEHDLIVKGKLKLCGINGDPTTAYPIFDAAPQRTENGELQELNSSWQDLFTGPLTVAGVGQYQVQAWVTFTSRGGGDYLQPMQFRFVRFPGSNGQYVQTGQIYEIANPYNDGSPRLMTLLVADHLIWGPATYPQLLKLQGRKLSGTGTSTAIGKLMSVTLQGPFQDGLTPP
jgi:hypothetical protein